MRIYRDDGIKWPLKFSDADKRGSAAQTNNRPDMIVILDTGKLGFFSSSKLTYLGIKYPDGSSQRIMMIEI